MPPPRKKTAIPENGQELSKKIREKINVIEDEDTQPILIKCDKCNKEILVPVPKKAVANCKSKELLVTYLHSDNKKRSHHCLIFEIDHEFQFQLTKGADSIISTEI